MDPEDISLLLRTLESVLSAADSGRSTTTVLSSVADSDITEYMKPLQWHEAQDLPPPVKKDTRPIHAFEFECPILGLFTAVSSRDARVFRVIQCETQDGAPLAEADFPFNDGLLPRVAGKGLDASVLWRCRRGQTKAVRLCFAYPSGAHPACRAAITKAIDDLSRKIDPERYGHQ
jgi:hypothetical protein